MKKLIGVCVVMIILSLISILFCGCGSVQQRSNVELLYPGNAETELAKQWVVLYGSGPESIEHYNIALARLQIQSIVQVINSQGKYISDVNDPNSLASKVEKLEAERTVLQERIDVLFAKDINDLSCSEFYTYANELGGKIGEKIQKTTELMHARLDLIEAGVITRSEADELLNSIESYIEHQSEIIARIDVLEQKRTPETIALELLGKDAVIDVSGVPLPKNCWRCTSSPYTGCASHDPKPVTHCNEDSGCGWAYWKCSLHSRTSVKPKPYIYENLIKIDPDPDPHPNTIRITPDELGTVCTKHGRLQWGERYVFPGDANKQYCINCAGDVLRLYLDKHIGRDPNSADSGY